MNTLLKSAGGITQVSADSRLLSNFDKVMEEAAASGRSIVSKNTGIHSGRIRIGLPAAFIHH